MSDTLDALVARWNALVAGAVAVAATLGTFVVAPPGAAGSAWGGFGQFLVAVLLGLWLVPVIAWSRRAHAGWWWTVAVAFVVAGGALYWAYTGRMESWTVPYPPAAEVPALVVVGDRLRPEAARHVEREAAAGRPLSDAELLFDAGGEAARAWEPGGVRARARTLAALYLACVVAFGSAIVAVVQAGYCMTRGPAPVPGREP